MRIRISQEAQRTQRATEEGIQHALSESALLNRLGGNVLIEPLRLL